MYPRASILILALVGVGASGAAMDIRIQASAGCAVGGTLSTSPKLSCSNVEFDLVKRNFQDESSSLVARKNSPFATSTDATTTTADSASSTSTQDSSTSTTDASSTSTTDSSSSTSTDSSSASSSTDASTSSYSDSTTSKRPSKTTTSTDSASSSSTSSPTPTSMSTSTSMSSSSSTSSATVAATTSPAASDTNSLPYSKNAGEIAATVVLVLFLVVGAALIARWQFLLYLARRRDRQAEAATKGGSYQALSRNGDDLEAPTSNVLNMQDISPVPPHMSEAQEIDIAITPAPLRTRPHFEQQRRSMSSNYYPVIPSDMHSEANAASHSRNVSDVSDLSTDESQTYRSATRRSIPSLLRSDSFERSITPPQSAVDTRPQYGPLSQSRSRRPGHGHQRSNSSGSSLRREFSFEQHQPQHLPPLPIPGASLSNHASQGHAQFVPEPRARVKSFSANVVGVGNRTRSTSPISPNREVFGG